MTTRPAERGNIFFYIFIGIVLFAALGYAMSRNSIRSDGVSDQKAKLIAAELISQANVMKSAVARIRLKGYKRIEVSFVNTVMTTGNYNNPNCTVNDCKVFQREGGNIPFPIPPTDAIDTTGVNWAITYNMNVSNIDFTDSGGYKSGMWLVLVDVKPAVCKQINNILYGITTDLAGRNVSAFGTAGTWNGTLSVGPASLSNAHFSPLTTKNMFCMPFTGGSFLLANTFNYSGTTTTVTKAKVYGFYVDLSPSGS